MPKGEVSEIRKYMSKQHSDDQSPNKRIQTGCRLTFIIIKCTKIKEWDNLLINKLQHEVKEILKALHIHIQLANVHRNVQM